MTATYIRYKEGDGFAVSVLVRRLGHCTLLGCSFSFCSFCHALQHGHRGLCGHPLHYFVLPLVMQCLFSKVGDKLGYCVQAFAAKSADFQNRSNLIISILDAFTYDRSSFILRNQRKRISSTVIIVVKNFLVKCTPLIFAYTL